MERVLIVEDNEDVASLYEMFLAQQFECRRAVSRNIAVQIIEAGFVPKCILMDFSMPGMGLQEFMDLVRPMKISIVMVSIFSDTDALAMSFGIRHFLPKAATPQAVVTIVKRAIDMAEKS